MNQYYLHLGSNRGDRKSFLMLAIQQIEEKIGAIHKQSSIYETEPWGMKEQDSFLNMAIEVSSKLNPEEVIETINAIQAALGVDFKTKWGPRNIDIDIIYVNSDIIATEKITIPHPRMYERNFVLVPMIEIAGEYEDPVKKITVDELYDLCKDTSEVYIYDETDE
ncbi:MAG: 2-amino-4-hydroxy-6-hydroxymethyldihydropteridine diphosphokinase [Saprospiraceae bacterium]|nr:2-amino-4-hydroxy-6-hydroxymethyldihydropteridine diphosphokinase [Saprospiraceae bacterium]